uniref:oleoyl-[acyl-carrier-protein] hydrolase n=1 Tax=Ditylenchus dipsaci TaxID=166011 RepID=A0A915DT51_9BILA
MHKCFLNGIKVTEIYGPTETTVWSLCHHWNSSNQEEAHDGSVIEGSLGILPLHLDSLAMGELCIVGQGVARGYIGQTSTPNTLSQLSDFGTICDATYNITKRIYRTGDLVRRISPKGPLRFIGRRDAQLKVRGIRVDGLEVASVITDEFRKLFQDDLSKAFVTTEKVNQEESCTIELVAFLVMLTPNYGTWEEKVHTLKTTLKTRLPSHMVPAFQLFVQYLAVQQQEHQHTAIVLDEDNCSIQLLLERVKKLWRKQLPLKPNHDLKPEDNFFACGGHSLSMLMLKKSVADEFTEITLETTKNKSRCVIGVLREADQSSDPTRSRNIYCIHPIGGTVYPYYSMLQVLPASCNVYGIHYHPDIPCNTLAELAQFYAEQVIEHSDSQPFLLLGHSLGGILAREMAVFLYVTKKLFIETVVCIDSWVLGTESLDLDVVRTYLVKQFELMPNKQKLLQGAMKLAQMLKEHIFSDASNIGICLFKAKLLGDSALKNSVRSNVDPAKLLEYEDNGWSQVSSNVQVFLCDGDHDSVLKSRKPCSIH